MIQKQKSGVTKLSSAVKAAGKKLQAKENDQIDANMVEVRIVADPDDTESIIVEWDDEVRSWAT